MSCVLTFQSETCHCPCHLVCTLTLAITITHSALQCILCNALLYTRSKHTGSAVESSTLLSWSSPVSSNRAGIGYLILLILSSWECKWLSAVLVLVSTHSHGGCAHSLPTAGSAQSAHLCASVMGPPPALALLLVT